MTDWSKRLLRFAVTGVLAHTRKVFAVSLLLTAICTVIIVARFDIRSGINDLMPESAKSVSDIATITDRMGSITRLSIILEAPDGDTRGISEAGKAHPAYAACLERAKALEEPADARCDDALVVFAYALGEQLESMDSVGYVHFHNDKRFFEDNILLYASVKELEELYDDVDQKLTDKRREIGEWKACLMTALDPDDCPEPGADTGDKEGDEGADDDEDDGYASKYKKQLDDSEVSFQGEYYEDTLPDGAQTLKIFVRFRDPSTTFKETQAHLANIQSEIDALDPSVFNEDLTVAFGGGFKSQSDSYNSIVNDVIMSASLTFGSIFLLIALFFRRLRAVLLIMLPLVMSISWTLAIAFSTIGYLNLITAFIFAVLLGLGIDFGIHILARYDEERSRGSSVDEAMTIALVEVGSANLSGAITTSATFFTLMLADFRGFSQFGFVAGVGVIMALLAMILVMPVIALLAHKVWAVNPRVLRGSNIPAITGKQRGLAWLAALVVLATVGGGGWIITQAEKVQFEENFYRLRMKTDASKRSRYDITNKRHPSPALLLLDSIEDIEQIERRFKRNRDPERVRLHFKVSTAYPNLYQLLNRNFGSAFMAGSGDHAVVPVMTAVTTLLPHALARSRSVTPTYHDYDTEGSRVLRDLNAFTRAYPNMAHQLSSELFPLVFANDRYHGLFAPTVLAHSWLPPHLHELVPSRYDSQQLHTVSDFVSIFSFMPGNEEEQQEKLAVIEDIRKRTSARRIRFLPPKDREGIEELREFLVEQTVSINDLPPWVKLQFRETGAHPAEPKEGSGVDYAFGNVGFIYQNTTSLDGAQTRRFAHDMGTIHVDGEPVTLSANALVFSEILEQIVDDGLKLTFVVMICVLLVVMIQVRSFMRTIIVMSPLVTSLLLLIGCMVLFGIKITFFNMVVIPMIIGIGIDDGIHLFHRYSEEGRGSILYALRHTGGSIFMTSATTSIGFSGMLFSMHQGLNTMGVLAVLGIGLAWFSTMTIQPALILLAERFDWKSIVPDKVFDPTPTVDKSHSTAEAA